MDLNLYLSESPVAAIVMATDVAAAQVLIHQELANQGIHVDVTGISLKQIDTSRARAYPIR